jgi:hypothetical protein
VKIAIIDSGIHPDHPHVGRVAGGVSIVSDDTIDRLGHGTAVAGAIRERAPHAELYAVKVFDRRLSTKAEILVRALEWCVAERMDLINMSLSANNLASIPGLPLVVTVPNVLTDAIAVLPDEICPRDSFYFRDGVFHASPEPRPIPGVPADRNFRGASFAVANMTGFVAAALMQTTRENLIGFLVAGAARDSMPPDSKLL